MVGHSSICSSVFRSNLIILCTISLAHRWIPGAVFGSPRNRYLENAETREKVLMGETKPFVRMDLVNPSKAIVPLTLFPGGDQPLTINATFDLTPIDQGVGWHR